MKLISKFFLLSFLITATTTVIAQDKAVHITTPNPNTPQWVPYGNTDFFNGQISSIRFNQSGQAFVAVYAPNESYTEFDISVMTLVNGAWTRLGNPISTSFPSRSPSLAVGPNGSPYIAFERSITATANDILVEKYNFSTHHWAFVGKPISNSIPNIQLSLSVSNQGAPYLGALDYTAAGTTVSVLTPDISAGGNWVKVGSTITSSSAGSYIDTFSLVTDKNGTPYVAYTAIASDGSTPITLVKFNGSTWIQVGNTIAATVDFAAPKLAFDTGNKPYIAYLYETTEDSPFKANVMVLSDENQWQPLGNLNVPHILQFTFDFAISSNGIPAFVYEGENGAIGLMYNGTNWVDIDNPGFAVAGGQTISLAANPTNQEFYVMFHDASNNNLVSVDQSQNQAIGVK